MKKSFVTLVFLLISSVAHGRPKEPFSKVVIKSNTATFRKDKNFASQFLLQYKNNVSVTFADGTVITSQLLDASFDKSLIKDKKKFFSGIKKIIFTKDVFIKRHRQSIRAERAEIFVREKLCKLQDNIKIEDLGDQDKKIPFCTHCDRAQFEWESEEIKLFGSADVPVNTVIHLGDRFKKRTLKKRAIAKEKKEQKRLEKKRKKRKR